MGLSAHSLSMPDNSKQYLYVLKKANSCFGVGTYIIKDERSEEDVLSKLDTLDYIKQVWVGGCMEYSTHLLFDGSKAISHHSFEFLMPEGFHVKGKATKHLGTKTIDHFQHLSLFENILCELNFKGLCCFDYKIEDDTVKIFELNPRYGGSLTRVVDELIPVLYEYLQEQCHEGVDSHYASTAVGQ